MIKQDIVLCSNETETAEMGLESVRIAGRRLVQMFNVQMAIF